MPKIGLILFTTLLFLVAGCTNERSSSLEKDSSNIKVSNASENSASPDEKTNEQDETQKIEPQPTLVPYNEGVEHIFFHPLIAYPELAFDGDYQEQGLNDYFTTIPEFEMMLEQLYKNQFILVNLSDVFEIDTNNPQHIIKKTFMLPEGKKPLVISIDDVNYYEYMLDNGTIYKLVLDEQGKIATSSYNPNGKKVISYSNEIIPILDAFVEKHPDFSLDGAKGTIALTGYEGILGYRTQQGALNQEAEIEQVKPVIAQLKKSGWEFASHSYGHLNVAKSSLKRLQSDTAAWKEEVEPLVGETTLFIYPYGARPEHNSDKFNFLVNSGYKVLSAVGPTSYTELVGGAYTMDRRHMDGIAFIKQPHTLKDLFDVELVLDKENRPEKYWKQ